MLRMWKLKLLGINSTTRIMLLLLSMLSTMLLFAASDARAAFPNGGPDFGAVLIGATKCSGSSYWQNLSPGGSLKCDSNGCSCTPSEVTRTVWFSTSGSGFTVTPGGPVVVPGCTGSVDLACCVTPTSVGEHYGSLIATVSPAFNGGSTSQSTSVHVKGIPSLVTAEPLGSSLSFGSAQVGQTVSHTFKVYNYNTFSVTIASISINNGNFSVSSGVNAVIPSNSYKSVTINFTPQSVGTISGTIQVNTTAEDPTYPCSGIGTPGPTITTSSNGNGNITPSTTVNYGDDFTVTTVPSTGYTLDKLTKNGTEVNATAGAAGIYTYTLNDIRIDYSLVASFKPVYTITATVEGSGGTISPATATTNYGSAGHNFTLTPQTGYTLDTLFDNGVDVTYSTYVTQKGDAFIYYLSFNNVTENHIIQATYKEGVIPVPVVPAISLPLVLVLVAGLSIILYWRGRAKKSDQN